MLSGYSVKCRHIIFVISYHLVHLDFLVSGYIKICSSLGISEFQTCFRKLMSRMLDIFPEGSLNRGFGACKDTNTENKFTWD